MTSDAADWTAMAALAQWVRGIVSVGHQGGNDDGDEHRDHHRCTALPDHLAAGVTVAIAVTVGLVHPP